MRMQVYCATMIMSFHASFKGSLHHGIYVGIHKSYIHICSCCWFRAVKSKVLLRSSSFSCFRAGSNTVSNKVLEVLHYAKTKTQSSQNSEVRTRYFISSSNIIDKKQPLR